MQTGKSPHCFHHGVRHGSRATCTYPNPVDGIIQIEAATCCPLSPGDMEKIKGYQPVTAEWQELLEDEWQRDGPDGRFTQVIRQIDSGNSSA